MNLGPKWPSEIVADGMRDRHRPMTNAELKELARSLKEAADEAEAQREIFEAGARPVGISNEYGIHMMARHLGIHTWWTDAFTRFTARWFPARKSHRDSRPRTF